MTTEQKKEIEKKVWNDIKEMINELPNYGLELLEEDNEPFSIYLEFRSIQELFDKNTLLQIKDITEYNKNLIIQKRPIIKKIKFNDIEIVEFDQDHFKFGTIGIKVNMIVK